MIRGPNIEYVLLSGVCVYVSGYEDSTSGESGLSESPHSRRPGSPSCGSDVVCDF